jgi:sporulation protein YlmC with PRC-barrel domain
MQIEYGAEVVDKNGTVMGTVDYVVRNSWTGEISKFMVRRKQPGKDLFLSPEDALEVTKSRIRLSVSSEELGQKSEE